MQPVNYTYTVLDVWVNLLVVRTLYWQAIRVYSTHRLDSVKQFFETC